MAELFGKSKKTISEHIRNIFNDGELDESMVVREFRTTTRHGAIKNKLQSQQGTQFRIWATKRLKEYIIKGFALNDDRFKTGNSMNYFNELQERIREIRLSEKFFYQKIKNIYTTSIDYDSKNKETMAQQHTPMYMKDWIDRLDIILQLNGRELLTHAGEISHKKAMNKSGEEYEKYLEEQKSIERIESFKELEGDIQRLEDDNK